MDYKYICLNCNNEFISNRNDKRIKFCSDSCGYKYGKNIICTCKQCGNEFKPKALDRTTFCSIDCYFKHRNDSWDKDIKVINIKPIIINMYNVECKWCNNIFATTNKAHVYCSDNCKNLHNNKKKEDRINKDKERYMERINNYLKKTMCCVCGKAIGNRCGKRYCAKCSNEIKMMHKGRISQSQRLRIYSRDNNICQLCGKKMRMDKINSFRVYNPHPSAPTIDHIIPISIAKQLGWTKEQIHCDSNLQSAHFKCNVAKGNKPMNEQLRMF
jgi:hypothetical protein